MKTLKIEGVTIDKYKGTSEGRTELLVDRNESREVLLRSGREEGRKKRRWRAVR